MSSQTLVTVMQLTLMRGLRTNDYVRGNRIGSRSPSVCGKSAVPTEQRSFAMTDLTTTIDTYLHAYAESDAERRARLVDAAWATNGELLDPPIEGRGRDGISALASTSRCGRIRSSPPARALPVGGTRTRRRGR